jgi:hypothetical protein
MNHKSSLHASPAASMRAHALALLAPLPASAATGTPPSGQPTTSTYSQQDLLKNWAFSVCLATVSKDAATKADANATAGAYMEFGRQGVEAYDEMRKLVETFAARRYSGSTGAEFNTMKCIDLLHSVELEGLSVRLTRTTK